MKTANQQYHAEGKRKRQYPKLTATEAEKRAFYRLKSRIPKWADRNYIRLFYVLAKEGDYQVDHIIPLNHPLVCGLHCEDNLQVTTKTYNKYKLNLFWPDMPEYTQKDYIELYDQARV